MSWVEMWEEGFYGSLYYWLIWIGGILFISGLGKVVKKINKNNQK